MRGRIKLLKLFDWKLFFVDFRWETVSIYNGVKVLNLIDKVPARKLPEEAHSSDAYLLFDKKGNFYQYREYNQDQTLRFEIGYHREKKIDPSGKNVLHVHEYSNSMLNRTTRPITKDEYIKYDQLFKGVPKWSEKH